MLGYHHGDVFLVTCNVSGKICNNCRAHLIWLPCRHVTVKRMASTLKAANKWLFFWTKYWIGALPYPWHSIYFQVRVHVEPSTDFQGICQLQETDTLIWWTYYCDAQLSWWLQSASTLVSHVVNSRLFETSNFKFLDSRTFGKTQNSHCLCNPCRCLNCHVWADNEPHCLRETLRTEQHCSLKNMQNPLVFRILLINWMAFCLRGAHVAVGGLVDIRRDQTWTPR